jgi:hypothetical protein
MSFSQKQLEPHFDLSADFKRIVASCRLRSILPIGAGMLCTGQVLSRKSHQDSKPLGKVEIPLLSSGPYRLPVNGLSPFVDFLGVNDPFSRAH